MFSDFCLHSLHQGLFTKWTKAYKARQLYTNPLDMTQSIIIQVGQCGNQIGYRFWDLALREYAEYNKTGIYDDSIKSFFSNSKTSKNDGDDICKGKEMIKELKARAVMVDMEEGVVNNILKGPLKHLFDNNQLITDVSGCGNNWAVGHCSYGSTYRDQIINVVRQTAEACDSLQCFFSIHSMGGGTGSGVGTAILKLLADEFPDVHRFTMAVYPSFDDDVITSPYNALLAMKELTNCADCVLPIENQALVGILKEIEKGIGPLRSGKRVYNSLNTNKVIKPNSVITSSAGTSGGKQHAFDAMNNIVANLILNLTSSARFDGSLNMDLNEITTNLVPFPKLHYLIPSMTPLYTLADVALPPRKLDQMFTDAFKKDHQLVSLDPKHSLYLACGIIVRGKVMMSDVRRNIDRLRNSLNFIYWNSNGWKTGLCYVPQSGQNYSLLTLANNTSFKYTCIGLKDRFMKLYRRKAHVHHYTQVEGFESNFFDEAVESIDWLVNEYNSLENSHLYAPECIPRLQIY